MTIGDQPKILNRRVRRVKAAEGTETCCPNERGLILALDDHRFFVFPKHFPHGV